METKTIKLGKRNCYKFDEVFDKNSCQNDVFIACGIQLVDGCFEGYNATILAYGQTASGKTYTMGSTY